MSKIDFKHFDGKDYLLTVDPDEGETPRQAFDEMFEGYANTADVATLVEVAVAPKINTTDATALIAAAVSPKLDSTTAATTYVKVTDRPFTVKYDGALGDGVANDTTAMQATVNRGGKIIIPRGIYNITAPIIVPGNSSIEFEGPSSRVKAVSTINGPMFRTTDAFVRNISFSGGGIVDCNELANTGIQPWWFSGLTIKGITILGAKNYGIKLGDTTAGGRSAGARISDLKIERLSNPIPATTNWGIFMENSGDHSLSDIEIVSYRGGVYSVSGTTSLVNVHAWADPALGVFDTAFEDAGNTNSYVNCYADTPASYGFRMRGFNNTIIGCQIYNNPAYGNDNIMRGVRFEQTAPFATVSNTKFMGGDVTHRLAVDVEINGNDHTFMAYGGNQWSQVVTRNADTRALVSKVRDQVFANKVSLPTASSSLRGQVAYIYGGVGVSDRAYICRKNATDTYEWAPLD